MPTSTSPVVMPAPFDSPLHLLPELAKAVAHNAVVFAAMVPWWGWVALVALATFGRLVRRLEAGTSRPRRRRRT